MPKSEMSLPTASSAPGKKLAGLDLSLTATGIVVLDPVGGTGNYTVSSGTVKSKPIGDSPKDEIQRLVELTASIHSTLPEKLDLVVMEGLSFASSMMGHSGLVALNYFLRELFYIQNVPFVIVAPTSLKKFATGKGNAEKDSIMMHCLERWGYHAKNNNEADAFVLAMIAKGLMFPEQWDKDELTKPQREVLTLLQKQI